MQSASPSAPQIVEERTARSLHHTPPPILPLPPEPTQKLMEVPNIVVLEPTPVPSSAERKDDNSSTLEQITELEHDHAIMSQADVSEMVSKRDSDPTDPLTSPFSTVEIGIKLKQTTTKSYRNSVLLKDPKNNPSKIIHIPSSRDPEKIRGFLVPKDFEPVKACKRRHLPPESVPLKCQHDVPIDKRKGSCSVHGTSIGFICTCVEEEL